MKTKSQTEGKKAFTKQVCVAYFKGKDGKGTCSPECQWYREGNKCVNSKSKSSEGKGIKEKVIYKGYVRIGGKDLLYNIRKWKCYFCKKWITEVIVENMVLLGGETCSSVYGLEKHFCSKCSKIISKADRLREEWEENRELLIKKENEPKITR